MRGETQPDRQRCYKFKTEKKGDVIMDRSSFSKTAARRKKMKGMSGRKEEGSIK